LRLEGVKTALVTNNSMESAQVVTGTHGISFDLILTRDDAPMKPAPDMLWRALEELGVGTLNAVMIGDTGADVGAAKAAGLSHCYLMAELWNAQFDGAGVTRIADMLELRNVLAQRL
jgi:phosphoglycolate phosphatase